MSPKRLSAPSASAMNAALPGGMIASMPLVGVAGDRSAGPYAFVVTATVVGSWIALAYAARSLNGRWHASAGAGVAAAAEREG